MSEPVDITPQKERRKDSQKGRRKKTRNLLQKVLQKERRKGPRKDRRNEHQNEPQNEPQKKPLWLPHDEFLPDADVIEGRPLHRASHWTLYALVGLVGCFLLWAIVSEVDEIVTARGKLVTTVPNLVVQPLETSIIQSIDVKIGQVVKKGQRLAELDPTFTQADVSQVLGRTHSLQAQVDRLEGELSGKGISGLKSQKDDEAKLQSGIYTEKAANYQARLQKLDDAIEKLDASLETNAYEHKVLEARFKTLAEIESMQEKLYAQNFGSKQKLLESRERRMEIERDMSVAHNRQAELSKELSGAKSERLAFIKEWRQKGLEELVAAKRDRDSSSGQLQKADRRNMLVSLTAPSDSVVLEIAKRSVGSVVREAEPLFTLVPLDAPIEIEAQIDSSDIGDVKLGDAVKIKFDAFPFQKHGTMSGQVRTLSEDAFAREPNQMRQGQGDAYYITRIQIDKGSTLRMAGKNFRLLPGLTLSAEIIVGRRSIISYFLYPLIRALDESIREP